jgi:hypothetical protein
VNFEIKLELRAVGGVFFFVNLFNSLDFLVAVLNLKRARQGTYDYDYDYDISARSRLILHPSTSAHQNNLIVDILMPNREVTRKSLMSYRNGGFKGQAIIKILFAITLSSELGSV